MNYRTSSVHYRKKFGCRVYRLAIDAGFTCPNRDGTAGYGGCTFCSASGGGDFAEEQCGDISKQLERAKTRIAFKNRGGKYIAYFQSFSNTYGPIDRLEALYRQAMEPEDVVGLSIGTRPDCLPPETAALLGRLNKVKPISVELGLQTIHDETARRFHRGYDTAIYLDAVKRLKDAGLEVVTHIILGLPGETPEMMEDTTRCVIASGVDGVKFHLLHVLKGTALAREYAAGAFECLTFDEYASILKRCLRLVPEDVTVHRITGDGAKAALIAPAWSADKKKVLAALQRYLLED